MANFRLDRLALTKTASPFTYQISGEFNKYSASTHAPLITGTYSQLNADLEIDVQPANPGNKTSFFYPNIDFSVFGRGNYLTLLLNDDYDEAGNPINYLEEVCGVVINDTDYPPPYKPNNRAKYAASALADNRTITSNIIIDQFIFERPNGSNPDLFTLHFVLSFAAGLRYTIDSLKIEYDLRLPTIPVLVLKVSPGPTSGPLTVEYPAAGEASILLQLSSYSKRGLPLVVTDTDLATKEHWDSVVKKKANLFCY